MEVQEARRMHHAMIHEADRQVCPDDYSVILISKSLQQRRRIEALLPSQEFTVRAYSVIRVALCEIDECEPDLVILHDESLSESGLRSIHRVRGVTNVPLVVLSECTDEMTRVKSLQVGADLVISADECEEPFACQQIRALLRRVKIEREAHKASGRSITRGALQLSPDFQTVTWHGAPVDLTRSLFKIIHLLSERPMHVLTRENIQDLVYGDNGLVNERTIDSHIKRLRQKFRETDPDFDAIETIYGVGYRFRAEADSLSSESLMPLQA
ncbi:response regulator transcription factor [Rhodobacteraceae bacterium 2376]|uniref:Response regulator transcription factor n=1 Tax=Rhabdonatronobacter sediminivivens TaxID=2743469 RepID=A0A7Z0KZI6_9RHOB|nr:response regulator transcription factor [Rhabdonatronobacter sediminivivens]NYS26737.1 response regulator transcription factor [Rhabdonatronobacter sediminivivens]